MTLLTTPREVSHGRHFSNFMFNLGMASRTLDLAIGHMLSMDKFRCVFPCQKLGLVMAFKTLILRNVAISFIDTNVALQTTHPTLDISLVVEGYPLELNIPLRLDMACAAFCTGETSLFSKRPRLVEVTGETIRFRDGQMGPLDDLGMAGGTPELLSPSQFLQVSSVIKGHVLKNHFLP
jgi:hypothetical protein